MDMNRRNCVLASMSRVRYMKKNYAYGYHIQKFTKFTISYLSHIYYIDHPVSHPL